MNQISITQMGDFHNPNSHFFGITFVLRNSHPFYDEIINNVSLGVANAINHLVNVDILDEAGNKLRYIMYPDVEG